VAAPGVSQVITKRPDGTQPRYLGALGHVGGLNYGWVNSGGPNQLSCLLQSPPDQRPDALNPGRQCQVIRGARVIWDGKLMEPAPTAAGWQVTAVGVGKAGADFAAVFSTWTAQNDAVNQAITRGLRWVNPGGNSIPAGVWTGQASDSGSLTVDGLLNLFCTAGGYTWYVSVTPSGNVLSVYLFPAATAANVNRVLVAAQPVARTLGGDVNTIWVRYQSSPDSAVTATFALTSVTHAASTAIHGVQEAYFDLSSAGPMTAGAAQALAQSVLNRYQRASYAGSFTVRPGELLNAGGAAMDLGLDHCGTIVRPVIADWGAGGEVVPDPAVFMTGAYSYDQDADTGTVTPFQSLATSVSGLTGAAGTILGWRAQQEAALDARQAAHAAIIRARWAREQARLRKRFHVPRGFQPGGPVRRPPPPPRVFPN
jgi:hypothetical protein